MSVDGAVEYARTAYRLERYQHCLEFLSELPAVQRGVPQLLFLKALCLARLGRGSEAAEAAADPLLAASLTADMRRELDEASRGEPAEDAGPTVKKAMDLWVVEKFDEALKVCEELLVEDSGRVLAWVWKARCLASLGKKAEAKRALERALALSPRDENALELKAELG